MTWFWFAIAALLCWSGSDFFSKLGCRDNKDKYSQFKMVMAVGVVMGLHAAYEIFIGGVEISWDVIWTYLPVSMLYIGSMTLGYVGLRYIELSISSPICNASGALVAIIAIVSGTADAMEWPQYLAIALACLGVFGLGLGKSRQKYLYLPFQYNDYIFAVICEEIGLFGALVIIGLFIALLIRGYRIALYARDRFSTVLGAGLVTLIGVQTVLNLGVVTNLLPSTGIALPFFSYGGTALAVNLAQMGVVLSISRQRYRVTPVSEEDMI